MSVTKGEQRKEGQITTGRVSWRSVSRTGRVLATLNPRFSGTPLPLGKYKDKQIYCNHREASILFPFTEGKIAEES